MIYVCEHHDQLLSLWVRRDLRGIRLAHVDFHDDMRGLLVDRRRHCAYAIGSLARDQAPADPGNFLAHAVIQGRLESVRWLHGPVGGRAWDMGIVRYESDLFSSHHRLRHRLAPGREHPLRFEELSLEHWNGPQAGERLSIDWDCFASVLLDADGIGRRVEGFVESLGQVVPDETYLVYSPEYSRPSLDGFRALVDRLAARYGQPVEWTSPGLREGRTRPSSVDASLPRGVVPRLILALRRRGFY